MGGVHGKVCSHATMIEAVQLQSLGMSRGWAQFGNGLSVLQDLISEVTCKEPYEWKDTTEHEWEFSSVVMNGNGAEPFKVSSP